MAREDDDLDRDDDDRPAKRRPRDDDDDRDPPKKKGGMSVGLILGILFGVMLMAGLPCIAIMIGLLLPAVQKTREAGARMTEQNNMKQIALGQFNHESTTNSFAGPFHSENGQINRDLSWRVSVLPFIEQDSVYRMIDRKAAWNSPANQAATNLPIKTYGSPYDGADSGKTTGFKVFVGGGAIFDDTPGAPPARSVMITDGTSNTIMFIAAQDQVPWASPQDIKYSPTTPLPKFGHINGPKTGFNVSMADGSVRFIRAGYNEQTLRLMITKADGQAVGDP